MKKTLKTIAMLCIIGVSLALVYACAFGEAVHGVNADTEAVKQEVEVNENKEPAATEVFNTSYLAGWDSGEPCGTIRMIGAWVFNHEPSNDTWVLQDESGELWVVRNRELDEDDFLLLWLADNGTPDNVEDDLIIKVWKEAR